MIHPSVIFIGGVTGSGKSSIGWELSRQLHCEFFDGDDFHTEENKAKMGRGEPLNGFPIS
jgi:gluconokinase